MKGFDKYFRQYFVPSDATFDWAKKDHIEKAPIWCSVDLRDGNQALIEPMSLAEKLNFFTLLVKLGFKEIEVGFPAASETEFRFIRTLIEENMIPQDVTIQVLTQAREHIIRRTFEAVAGAPHAIIHLYNSTSVAQREQVFCRSQEEIKQIAIEGARLLKNLADETDGHFSFEYSPESFSGTEIEYAVEVCNAVVDIWQPTAEQKVIINLPATVETSLPHVFATQVEYVDKHLEQRDHVLISIHPHNDRGCGVADAELALLAGADRIEGTLFGNGERTGNVDIITLALNLYTHGVDPGLDFHDLPGIREVYETCTGMRVHDRQPYSGDLVYSAFSGSHQDAIAKGMAWREQKNLYQWSVPYLPIDPTDVGRTYENDVIRINSQSGKGGISYILQQNFGFALPAAMREEVGYMIKDVSDQEHKELSPSWIHALFMETYVDYKPYLQVEEVHFRQGSTMQATVTFSYRYKKTVVDSFGNGRLDAVSNAIKQFFGLDYDLFSYEEHALTTGSASRAVAYVGICCDKQKFWGVGIDGDIIRASIDALIVAVNKIGQVAGTTGKKKDDRINQMLRYIKEHYQKVDLTILSEEFFLSKPYISKSIKDHTGRTFGENLRMIRLDRAAQMLKNGHLTVEAIARSVGYPSVEHFNRQFKRQFRMTPIEYRKQDT
ncbi:MAG: 2-isopropylmalate synthase [Lachnospiraceae bacterium]|nr:2-isopropylmalate synthase [Lachnospiraceae bacterium]MDY5741515.1 2-isopropylmalate synthase [Lachnospiraceae bacterium]